MAAAVFDQLAALERRGGRAHADPPHAEHAGEKLLRHQEIGGAGTVARHQQPARQSRLDHMKAVAGGGARKLPHQSAGVEQQHLAQRRRATHGHVEAGLAHAQAGSGALHHGPDRRACHAERQRNAHHAFTADHTDFQREMTALEGEQRHQSLDREINVAHRLAGFVEHFAEGQIDRRQLRLQLVPCLARQGRQQEIEDPGHLSSWPPGRLPVCALAHSGAGKRSS